VNFFAENKTVVKEFFSEALNNKNPSLTGFPLVGFSRVVVRPKICANIFLNIVLLIYFISALNVVQNPHVSVLKIMFIC
jgi:hypothetical protein